MSHLSWASSAVFPVMLMLLMLFPVMLMVSTVVISELWCCMVATYSKIAASYYALFHINGSSFPRICYLFY